MVINSPGCLILSSLSTCNRGLQVLHVVTLPPCGLLFMPYYLQVQQAVQMLLVDTNDNNICMQFTTHAIPELFSVIVS